ncbi:MAG: hypothetical protein LUP95_02775 [Euryarchaeota archaeon]|nr:hypothetical protein [Euryarchaeota archaeon]
MKRQYIALLIVLAALVILSFWAASTTTTHDIERQLTNTSNEQHGGNEGLIEGNLLLYLGVTGMLFVIAAAAYFLVLKKR